MSTQRISELRTLIIAAKKAYYNSDSSLMTDLEFDALESELRALSPDDDVLLSVGSAPSLTDLQNAMLTKAKHFMPMGSQAKVNSKDEFFTWYEKNNVSKIHASLKYDGASAAAYFKNGWLSQVITRGDGDTGEDITANARHFKGLPHFIKNFTGSVRFEVVLTIDDWKKIDPSQSKNPRNVGTGIMGRKNGHQSEFLTVFAFDVTRLHDNGDLFDFYFEQVKLDYLKSIGFNVVQSQICNTFTQAVDYFDSITKERDQLPFWIDGVVLKINDIAQQMELGVTSGRPKGQIAWKFDSVGQQTVLTGVTISGGHTGALIPTATFEPVEIGGTTVSNASLSNFDEIARLNIAIGDTIFVVKANDIIPKITHVIHRPDYRTSIDTPDVCPFCGGDVGKRTTHNGEDGAITECKNPECSKKSIGKIRRWIKSLDILGIGDTILESMVDQLDLVDAGDLYRLKDRLDDLANICTHEERGLTLGYKRANSILESIDAKRNLSLSEFLGSLGIDSLGKRRVELMINSANGELNEFHQWTDNTPGLKSERLAEKAGVPNIGYQIQEGIDSMNAVMDKLLEAGVTIKPTLKASTTLNATLKTVCISGKLNSGKKKSDYAQPLLATGFTLVDDVAKGLDYLVLADPLSTSSKSQKAKKLGIAIIGEDDLIKICVV